MSGTVVAANARPCGACSSTPRISIRDLPPTLAGPHAAHVGKGICRWPTTQADQRRAGAAGALEAPMGLSRSGSSRGAVGVVGWPRVCARASCCRAPARQRELIVRPELQPAQVSGVSCIRRAWIEPHARVCRLLLLHRRRCCDPSAPAAQADLAAATTPPRAYHTACNGHTG
jgi:hypothetical protein